MDALLNTIVGVVLAAALALLSYLLRILITTLTKHSEDLIKLSGLVEGLRTDSVSSEITVEKYHNEIIDLKVASMELNTKQQELSARVEHIAEFLKNSLGKPRHN